MRQRVEQQVEVHKTRVGIPARHQPPHRFVVKRAFDVEQAPELVVGTDVISGKDMESSQAAQQDVLSAVQRPMPRKLVSCSTAVESSS